MFCRPRRGTACERHTRCAGASPLAPFPPQRVEVPWTGAGGREIQEEEAEQYRGLTFPTSGGSECEYHDQGLIGSVADFVEQGRAKFFCVNTNTSDSFHNKSAHPLHRSWMQRMYDEYLVAEVVPFVHHHCRGWQPIATLGRRSAPTTR